MFGMVTQKNNWFVFGNYFFCPSKKSISDPSISTLTISGFKFSNLQNHLGNRLDCIYFGNIFFEF